MRSSKPSPNPSEIKADDLLLIKRISSGSSAALGSLYDRYGRLVFSLAVSLSGDEAAAEEITQDVFTQVWYKAATYQVEQASVTTWLTSITRHRAIDRFRRQNVRPEGHQVSWDEDPLMEIPSDGNVEEQAEIDLQGQRLHKAINTLPDEQKRVLALAFFQGYTHEEIAQVCAEPLGTVKTRIRLAMRKLRQVLINE
jgi:RNA polymerase sigma-70 factor (ECF subfamily)